MSELVWIHRFNGNELGLRGAGGFCLVPVEARIIFFPERNFNLEPEISETITLKYSATGENLELTYGKPPSKTEHRLSLTGAVLKSHIGDEASNSDIKPGRIGCFFRKGNEVFLSIAEPDSAYGKLLDLFPVRGKNNNLVTQTIVDNIQLNEQVTSLALDVSTLSKPFLLLAGISGTGKTRFVREQAKTSGQFNETYCLTSVRPDWHEPSDLLGYISRLAKDGEAEYITTDVLKFIAKAWRAIASPESDLTIEEQASEEQDERLVVTGDSDALKSVLPYWLCLDEMNLAPVEQYFADYLSVLETREWHWANDNFTFSSDALLKPATISEVADKDKLRKELGFEAPEYDELWQLICQHGLGIPFNLIVAGTVNMDETTHGFSRKVIDRALSFDFGAFFPNDFDEFFTPPNRNKRLSYPIWSHAIKADVDFEVDAQGGGKINVGTATVSFLNQVNSVLKNTPFQLAFRALNELLLAVVSSQPQDELALKAIWDDFMMCKVLPRIEGDSDKLTNSDGNDVLVELNSKLATELAPIWQAEKNDEANQRPDLYREKVAADGATGEQKVLRIPCRSKEKLKWMSDRLERATFTSFWP